MIGLRLIGFRWHGFEWWRVEGWFGEESVGVIIKASVWSCQGVVTGVWAGHQSAGLVAGDLAWLSRQINGYQNAARA